MGNCDYCLFNGPHMLRLTWAIPLAVLNRENFPQGRKSTFTVPAAVDARASVLQLYIDWDPHGRLDNLFVTYRVAKKQDFGLPPGFNETVLVHRQVWATDDTTLLAALATGKSYHNPQDRVLIEKVSGDQDAAQVHVCRYESAVGECDPGGGAATVTTSIVNVGDAADMVSPAAAEVLEAIPKGKRAIEDVHTEDVQPDYSLESTRAALDALGKKGPGRGPVLKVALQRKELADEVGSRGAAAEEEVAGSLPGRVAEEPFG
jgi:hypothetical protein